MHKPLLNITAKRAVNIVVLLFFLSVATTAWAQGDGGTETGGLLAGTLKSQRISGGVALLKNGAYGLGFYSVNANTTIASNTAYAPEAKTILIDMSSLDHVEASIGEVRPSSTNVQRIYDLQGRLLQQVRHGLYIIRHADGRTEKVVK